VWAPDANATGARETSPLLQPEKGVCEATSTAMGTTRDRPQHGVQERIGANLQVSAPVN